jgi:hypothetical protein
MASYGSGLVIWIVFVVFLTLNFSWKIIWEY